MIGHDRRRILHLNVTRNPNALWVMLQLREAWEDGDSSANSKAGEKKVDSTIVSD